MLRKFRRLEAEDIVPKGPRGARDAVAALKAGRRLGMLVDQKMNDGIVVPFLGQDAMTAPAVAELAYRYDCPLVPARVERLDGARFRVSFFPPLEKPASGDRQADIRELMSLVNATLGDWIQERPEQWLWVHNRWPD